MSFSHSPDLLVAAVGPIMRHRPQPLEERIGIGLVRLRANTPKTFYQRQVGLSLIARSHTTIVETVALNFHNTSLLLMILIVTM